MTATATEVQQFGHELRTPLNAILGNVELLLDGSAGPLSAEARACLGEVQIASRRLSRQVQMLLLWAEVRGGGVQRGAGTLDLIALIGHNRAGKRAEPLPIEPCDACLSVRGDRFWLQTLIDEILALERAPRGRLAPALVLERGADGATLGFVWPQFRAAEVEPLQWALIESVAQVQGATAALTASGVRLYWPSGQLAAAPVATEAPIFGTDPGPASGDRGDRSPGRD
jgi:His Kinase A (phospho-acceptor) domain